MNEQQMYNELMERYGVSEEALQLVTDVAGMSRETLEAVLWSVSGYRYFGQEDEEEEEEEEE